MASLTSNPMEEMMEEEEYQASTDSNIASAGGYRRSWSNPGPEPDMNRPNTLRLCSGKIGIPPKPDDNDILCFLILKI